MDVASALGLTPRYDEPSYLWPRPKYRGVIHAAAAVAVIPLAVLLVIAADGTLASVAAAIYAVSQFVVFATSACYHRLAETPHVRRRMQIADHAMIYVLMAGTWAPVCLLVLPETAGRLTMGGIAAVSTMGIGLKLFGVDRFPQTANALYVVIGWAGLLALPSIIANADPAALGLLATGGVAYSAGAVVLLFKHPDPRPDIFGYHEVWHAATVVAAACHFAAVWVMAA